MRVTALQALETEGDAATAHPETMDAGLIKSQCAEAIRACEAAKDMEGVLAQNIHLDEFLTKLLGMEEDIKNLIRSRVKTLREDVANQIVTGLAQHAYKVGQ